MKSLVAGWVSDDPKFSLFFVRFLYRHPRGVTVTPDLLRRFGGFVLYGEKLNFENSMCDTIYSCVKFLILNWVMFCFLFL
jgi:hypothetical protein